MALTPQDVLKTKHDIFQNNIDWVAKQTQVLNDLINGVSEEDDGSDLVAMQPFSFRGTCGTKKTAAGLVDCNAFGNNQFTNVTGFCTYDLMISDDKIIEDNLQYIGTDREISPWFDNKTAQIELFNTNIRRLLDFRNIALKSALNDAPLVTSNTTDGTIIYIGADNNGAYVQNAFDSTYTNEYYGKFNIQQTITSNNLILSFNASINQNGNYYTASNIDTCESLNENVLKAYPVIAVSNDSNVKYQINNYNNTSNNYTVYNYNYTTPNGVNVPLSFGVGGIFIGAQGSLISFDDLIGTLNLALPDINAEFNLLGDDLGVDLPAITIPTYDEIKYSDRGSFYITPIKQLPPLPNAPDIADTVIDVSEPLDMLSYGFGALLSAFDSLGVTLTLTFTFLACLVINKLRGD